MSRLSKVLAYCDDMSDNPRKVIAVKAFDSKYRGWLHKQYNITPDQVLEMYDNQQGACATCLKVFTNMDRRIPCVDHCHDTGRVRGLLCDQCNTALGQVKDSVDTLANMIKYLSKP